VIRLHANGSPRLHIDGLKCLYANERTVCIRTLFPFVRKRMQATDPALQVCRVIRKCSLLRLLHTFARTQIDVFARKRIVAAGCIRKMHLRAEASIRVYTNASFLRVPTYFQRIPNRPPAPLLLLATLPPEADEILPVGSERLAMAVQMDVVGRAPAGARGYCVSIKHQLSQIQRWFPAASRAEVPMFGLDPFEWPAAPVSGIYELVSLDARCLPLGGPRFSVAIDWIDRRLHDSDGDRTYKPPLRA